MLYFQLLFLLLLPNLFSQSIVIDEIQYKTILWGKEEDDFLKGEFAKGSFFKNENDLVVCRGRMWKGNPPKSLSTFSYKDTVITNIGEFNNRAVELLERNERGDWAEASSMLHAIISFDPLFFPARYNYGRFFYLQKNFKESKSEFIQASNIIPAYYRSYLQLGLISLYLGKKLEAEGYLKQAVRKSEFNNEALIYLAEIYWKEGLVTRAKEYINEADKLDENLLPTIIRRQKPAFPVLDFTTVIENPNANPNPKIAEALLYFHQEKYALAYKIFKSIDTNHLNKEKVPYLKKMHYYFAESATKLLDTKTAAAQYSEVLKYPFDPFFQEVTFNSVVKKQNLAANVQ